MQMENDKILQIDWSEYIYRGPFTSNKSLQTQIKSEIVLKLDQNEIFDNEKVSKLNSRTLTNSSILTQQSCPASKSGDKIQSGSQIIPSIAIKTIQQVCPRDQTEKHTQKDHPIFSKRRKIQNHRFNSKDKSRSVYVVIDIETTGLSKYNDRIIEIGGAKIHIDSSACDDKVQIVEQFHTLVNPEIKIGRFITQLTGINDQMVKDAPKIQQIIDKFMEFLDEHTFVAHNATFDYGFIAYNFEKYCKKQMKNQKLCTRKLANRLLPTLGSKNVQTLCRHFDIVNENEHRAMSDVHATVKIFNNMLNILEKHKITNKSEIIKFQKSPLSKVRKQMNLKA